MRNSLAATVRWCAICALAPPLIVLVLASMLLTLLAEIATWVAEMATDLFNTVRNWRP